MRLVGREPGNRARKQPEDLIRKSCTRHRSWCKLVPDLHEKRTAGGFAERGRGTGKRERKRRIKGGRERERERERERDPANVQGRDTFSWIGFPALKTRFSVSKLVLMQSILSRVLIPPTAHVRLGLIPLLALWFVVLISKNLTKDICLRKVVTYLLMAPFSSHNLFLFTLC